MTPFLIAFLAGVASGVLITLAAMWALADLGGDDHE